MTAPILLTIFDSIYLFALTGLVGSILFFSFAVAPIIFNVLDAESGAKFVRVLFPRYYLWGLISCALALPALICGTLSFPELRGPAVGIQAGLILLSLLIMLYCGNTLTPAINAAKDAGPSSAGRFDRLHRRSVRLNAFVLLIGLGLLVGFAMRKAPRTRGIVEPSSSESTLTARP